MGALCGREDHFDALHGKGQTLGSASASSATPKQPASAASPPAKNAPTPLPLSNAPRGADDTERREAMLKAAEARNKTANTKGLSPSGGGKLASQLAAQKADGGRAEEAKRIAEDRAKGEALRWD